MHNFASKSHQPCKNRADAPIPITPARFLTGAPGKNRLCVVRGISEMRCGRGAWMRFPDVFGAAVSSRARIAGSPAGKGSLTHTHATTARFSPAAGRRVLSPTGIHVSPCLCVGSDGTTSTERRRARSSSLPAEKRGPPLAPNMLTCCRPAQRLGGTSHYEGSTPGRGGKLNPMFTKSHALSSYRRSPTQLATDFISGEALVCLFCS